MLTVTNLNFGYTPRAPLFTSLDLQLSSGTICGLLGRNGAGKTTLLKLIAGLRLPVAGRIMCLGCNPRRREKDYCQQIFLLPEAFDLPPLRASAWARSLGRFYPGFDEDRYRSNSKAFSIDPEQRLQRYSFGQQKKFLLALGLALNPRLLLLDEPTNGLDIPSKRVFRKLLANAVSDETLVLISTHQAGDIDMLIDEVIIIDDGRIVFHEALDHIGQRLFFDTVPVLPPDLQPLYREAVPGGHLCITPNTGGCPSSVRLEPLFNAVTADPGSITALFDKKEDRHA